MKSLHKISCKIILYNQHHTKILLCKYNQDHYGLIGGHIDEGESPDEGMRREIREEIGANIEDLRRFSFMQHPHGKIVLLYTGSISEDYSFTIDRSELQSVVWADANDIKNNTYPAVNYQEYLVQAFN